MNIRSYQKEDYNAIHHLLKEEGWSAFIEGDKEAYKKALLSSLTYVAVNEDGIQGFIRAITDGVYLSFVGEIIVAKEFRRNHIGSLLVNHIAEHHPSVKIELISDIDKFYSSNGFHSVGSGLRRTT